MTVPAKIASYMAAAKPLLAGMDGEGARAVEPPDAGFASPRPEDSDALAKNCWLCIRPVRLSGPLSVKRPLPGTKPTTAAGRCWISWKIFCFQPKKQTFEVNPLKVLVIIPCYNESENICRVVQRLKATCPDVDYLVVNDCSTDDSARILRENGYNYLDLPLNLGIGGVCRAVICTPLPTIMTSPFRWTATASTTPNIFTM